jgi:mxaL protein
MNVRDMSKAGKPQSRLDAVKDNLRHMIAELPCESRVGLGMFSERRTFILFKPMEVCANFSSLDASIGELDWRMAWEGDSYVTNGIYDAIAYAARLDADLIFYTEGQEAPPLPFSGPPPFTGKPGEVKGLIVGVGGKALSPIPKFDEQGREIGVYGPNDVLQESRFGLPPPGVENRPGYHPRNAPFGVMPAGNEHLSSVKEEHLREIARTTGLGYAVFGSPEEILQNFESVARPREVEIAADIRPYPEGFALLFLVLLYGGAPLAERFRGRGPVPWRNWLAPVSLKLKGVHP